MQFYLELLGYLASVLVAISLMMSSVLKLRLINLVGFFQQHGIRKLMSTPHNSAHAGYLKRMGFQQEMDQEGNLVCALVLSA